MTERISKLKTSQESVKPSFSSERARLVTEAELMFKDEPQVIAKAKMLDYVLENMTIFIQEGELIVGNLADKPRCAPVYPEFGAKWVLDEMDEFATRGTDPLYISDEDRKELEEILPKWEGHSFDVRARKTISEEANRAAEAGIFTIGSIDTSPGHILPYYEKILNTGFSGLIKEIEETKEKNKDNSTKEQNDFWDASIIALNAGIKFSNRYAKLARKMADETDDKEWKKDLITIAENCENIPENSASSFQEAVQFVWFIHLIMNIESNGHGNSFGRFDQYCGKFYDEDVNSGKISKEYAEEILCCFFIKCTDIIKLRDKANSDAFAGYPMWHNIIIGGQNADGSDSTNALSFAMLDANDTVRTSSPTMSIRYHENLSKELFYKGVDMIQRGLSTPAFFNDDLVMDILIEKGYDKDEVYDWGIYGCVQPGVQGKSDTRPTVGYVNALKCLELALNRGVDPNTGEKISKDYGELNNIEDLKEAVYGTLDYFVSMMCEAYIIVGELHRDYGQMPFNSTMIDGTIQSGKSIQNGGAKYNEASGLMSGIANTADSIAAIDTLVYQQKKLTMDELMNVLDKNFEGYETTRLMLLNDAPKYGNDIDYVDEIAAEIVKAYKSAMDKYRENRGGKFVLEVESQSNNVAQGKVVGATPDGRFAGGTLNDNSSPAMGRDMNGPTAAVMSVSKLDQINAQAGTLFNLRFDDRSVAGEKGANVIGGVIKTYFDHRGEHIQINVVDNETLIAAQTNPEEYRSLIVRVAGYLAYFTELDKAVQDSIIQRTAHTA